MGDNTILGYRFHDASLLELALTHPSAGTPNNQRLEFLGDAILEYLISVRLFRQMPKAQEGELTRTRLQLVCEETLSDIARRWGIGERLRMDHGEERTGGRDKPSVLCDAMEAVLAAIWLDGGVSAARDTVERCWPKRAEPFRPNEAKNRLQEHYQRNGGDPPEYRVLERSGPDHAPSFTVGVYYAGEQLATGTGSSKKLAESEAAMEALRKIEATK